MIAHRLRSVLSGSALSLLVVAGGACEKDGASSPSKTSSDVTTTSAIVTAPAPPCSRGEVQAWNNGETLCVRSCASIGGCPDGHAARRCASNQILAGAPDSDVDYCVDKP